MKKFLLSALKNIGLVSFGAIAGVSMHTIWLLKMAQKEEKNIKIPAMLHIRDIRFPSLSDAEKTLSTIKEFIDIYGFFSLADFYELIGMTPDFSDYQKGWTNAEDFGDLNSMIRRIGYEYGIQLPLIVKIA